MKNVTKIALKSCTSLSLAGAAMFVLSAPAEAGSVKNGNVTDLTVYGQVNRTFMVYDDGEEIGYRNMDGDAGSTRFGLKASGKINESVSVGARLEAELQSNDPATISQSTESDSASGFTERLAFIYINHKQFGKLTMGQASAVSDGMSDGLDLGYVAGAFDGVETGRRSVNAVLFREDNAGAALSSRKIGNFFGTFDRGRQDQINYVSPNINGFKLEAGLYDAGDWGAGVHYDNKIGAFKVRGRAFYESLTNSSTSEGAWQVGGSVKHDSGISLTGVYGQSLAVDGAEDDARWAATVGYTANLNALGPTGIGVNVSGSQDRTVVGSEAIAVGLGFNQQIKGAGTNIYGNVAFWDVDLPSSQTPLDQVVTMLVGMQVKF